MERSELILSALAVAIAAAGAYSDLKTRKIPNRLTIPAILCFWLAGLLRGGWPGVLDSAAGVAAGALTAIFWLLGALKAGDVKLYMAVGALAGWRFCAGTFVYSVLCGGVAGTCLLLKSGTAAKAFRNLKNWLFQLTAARTYQPYEPASGTPRLCFGVCIALGALAMLLKGH